MKIKHKDGSIDTVERGANITEMDGGVIVIGSDGGEICRYPAARAVEVIAEAPPAPKAKPKLSFKKKDE